MATTLQRPAGKPQVTAVPAAAAQPAKARLMSLDALRGFDMFWIIGAGPLALALEELSPNTVTRFLTTQLKHVEWEGFHCYDLIFPLFLFIIGASMVFSLDKALATGGPWQTMWRVARRSVLLFALGVFYYGGISKPWPDVQLAGVLQRIALCYFLAACIYCCVRSVKGIVIACVILLVGYWALVTFVPFPDLKLQQSAVDEISQRVGSTSPFAIAAAVPDRISGVYEEGRNLTNFVDFLLLPGKKSQVYYINEGLLSTLPSVALPLFGALAALLITNARIEPRRKIAWLLVAGIVGVALGLLWSVQFPLIKRIWTSSFVLLTGGLSAMILALFYYLVDVKEYRRWCQPFVWIGCNALTIYLVTRIVDFQALAERLAGGDFKRFLDTNVALGFGRLTVALLGLSLAILLTRFLYKRGILLRV